MEQRKCEECGETIKGRIDKKFCGDLCRNTYNNKLNSDSNNLVRNVNNILRKNRRILESLLSGEKTTVSRQKLLDNGFNFQFFTGQTITRNNHTYTFCYEYGYMPLENNIVLIIKRQPERIL